MDNTPDNILINTGRNDFSYNIEKSSDLCDFDVYTVNNGVYFSEVINTEYDINPFT